MSTIRSTFARQRWWRVGGIGVVAAALAVLGPAPSVEASPDSRAGVFRLTFSGFVSSAAWSTCGDLAEEAVGTVCHFTDLQVFLSSGSEQAGSEYHSHDPRSGVVKTFDSTCVVNDVEFEPGVVERMCLPLVERFGRATEADVRADPRLERTVASAVVPVQVYDFTTGAETYDDLAVSVTVDGAGQTRRIDERTHIVDRTMMFREGTRGWERDCTASATFDGEPVAGDLVGCSMLRVRQAELRVYHGPAWSAKP